MTLDRSKILVKHDQLCLLPSHKISTHLTSWSERSCYFLEATSNWDLNTKWLTSRSQKLQNPWDFGRHINPNDKSKWHEIFLTHIFLYDLWDRKVTDPKKLKQKRYDQKTDLAQSFQKLITLTKHMLFFWNFENRRAL
jgi:hypothetical protein